ncbi:universal stress protein [Dactylosporangium darangshiense]|uniref:Universal stress protein n=1 Tax=Dactylosporangium darangshiense TaxID=579108 RepID=A0ABP8DVY1_9ACTN
MSVETFGTPSVVVGVDGSEPSTHALRWAHYLADATGSRLDVITTWEFPVSWVGIPADWDPAQEAQRILDATLDEVFAADKPSGLRTVVIEGGAAQTLLEASRTARMLIVGSRGHGGFAGLLLGSVSAACAEHATCPVLVVHGSAPPPGS